uniref:Uncharacterized protein n=1 Tax=Ananas comosus var. bracteatus TaxID=296719 RepID=A0A6V7Q8A6_ANACO|nr:unnamed protein product [Ananas comosus var. bracteatus]
MGSCASTQKNPSCLVVVSRFGLGNKSKRVFDPSPATENPVNGRDLVGGVDLKEKALELGLGCRSPEFGSKEEEVFFDSQAWLDSDCEDDFFSVNGDFMPSRGSTPNHQPSAPTRPTANNVQFADKFPDSKSEPSPTGRKRLAELFRETSQHESTVGTQNTVEARILANGEDDDARNIVNCGRPEKSLDGTPYISEASSNRSSDATPSREERNKREKAWDTIRCCLPSLVPNFHFDEKAEKISSGPCTA